MTKNHEPAPLKNIDETFQSASEKKRRNFRQEFFTAAIGASVLITAACGDSEVGATSAPKPGTTTEASIDPTSPEPIQTIEASPDPIETEVPEHTMSATVDYELFDDWDDLEIEEKRERCHTLFDQNGLKRLKDMYYDTADMEPQEIIDYWQARYDIAWDVNLDVSDGRNQQVGSNILECITSNRGGEDDAFFRFSNGMQGAGQNLANGRAVSPNIRGYDLGHITRHSGGVWTNGEGWNPFVIERYASDDFGSDHIQYVFEEARYLDDWYLAEIHVGDGGDIKWGVSQKPVVVDETRANAPYDLGR